MKLKCIYHGCLLVCEPCSIQETRYFVSCPRCDFLPAGIGDTQTSAAAEYLKAQIEDLESGDLCS